MKKVFFVASLLLVLLFSGQRLFAQENINLVIKKFVNDDYPTLRFELTPNNDFGVPIDQLSPENFEISDDLGRLESTITELIDDDEPISIMMVLDASGSMQQSGRLNEVKNQVVSFREELKERDQLGVLFFNVENIEDEESNRVELFPAPDAREFVPSTDGGGAINFINQFAAGDDLAGAPLYDAMFRSVQVLAQNAQSDRRAIIMITDGVDYAQGALVDPSEEVLPLGSIHSDLEIVVTAAQQEGIPIFTIGLASEPEEGEPFSGVDAVELTKIARNSGGTESIDQDPTGLTPLLNAIADRLKTKYEVTTEALLAADNQEHELTVQVSSNLGTSTTQQTFRALYPLEPIIELNYLDNENQLHEADNLGAGVFGTIEFRPTFFARNEVARVEYWFEDSKIRNIETPPFYLEIDTSSQPYSNRIGILSDLKIIAFSNSDNSDEEYASEFEKDMLILSCTLLCLAAENNFTTLDTNTFVTIWGALIFLILLLIFFIVFSLIRRRRRKAEELLLAQQQAQAYGTYQYSNPMPVIPKTDEQINVGPLATGVPAPASDTIIDSSFTPNSPFPDQSDPKTSPDLSNPTGASPTTEILVRPPSQLAYLFNPENGQQHQLNDPLMTIGRLPENRICLPDPAVSGKHAVIKVENDQYVIYDLGASNPVMINGQNLFGSHILLNNDQVTIGRQDWVFKELDQ